MTSYKHLTEGPLLRLIRQHDDPIKFNHAVIKKQLKKQLKLNPRGAANTREIAAAFRRYQETNRKR